MELDLIQRVGGIARGDKQPAAALEQRQHVMLAQQLFADQAHCVLIVVERRYIQQRHPELDSIGSRKLCACHKLLLREPLG
ncbi:hypothetical protein D3C71_869350 [compost metagenome]